MGEKSEYKASAIISEDHLAPLNDRQRAIYAAALTDFREYLRTAGKDPDKRIGYASKTVPERVSRFHRAVKWTWKTHEVTTEFTTAHADRVVEALATDSFRRTDGDRYAPDSKRKITDAIANWFDFQGVEWTSHVTFSGDHTPDHADPFSKRELRRLWDTALQYKSIPRYNNLSPTERDRWKASIAQDLGKPKTEVRPADWDAINHNWKIPSLIRTTRTAGWRPAMVERLRVDWYEPVTQTIVIPAGMAVKNNARWEQKLSNEGALALEKWLDQRANIEAYDGRSEVWLNREGNPYQSGSLNRLLRNLMNDAAINPRGRKLVWYSFRHSIGTYLYDEYKDLTIVAETLRQKSTSSAARYVHPTDELKTEVAEIL